MRIAGRYSFNGGAEHVAKHYGALLAEVEGALSKVDAATYKTKISEEKTNPGALLFSPSDLNKAIKAAFPPGWKPFREKCKYPTNFYVKGFKPKSTSKGAFREMDFVKQGLGVEVQFGKYAFMVYNVAAKMTIFRNLGVIKAGIEIVPVKDLADEMSTGVSYFEQFVWDLEKRGTSNIDVPVLILGIDADPAGIRPPSKTPIKAKATWKERGRSPPGPKKK